MIQVQFKDSIVQELVSQAVIRSVSHGQILTASPSGLQASVFIGDRLPTSLQYQKVVVFGPAPALQAKPTPLALADGDRLHFQSHVLTQNLHLRERHFQRYDFAREWNNLGYGRINLAPNTPWSIGQSFDVGEIFAGVWDEPKRAVLWYNRNTGPIDGFDWRMIENFISDYRATGADALACLPVLSEIPADTTGAVTFRIDCDENIESGRPLFELYRRRDLPFSIAVKTDQPINAGAVSLMREILAAGGSVVSHSHTHACDWGKSPEWEATTSRGILEKTLNISVRYAVSPFHQNSERAVRGILKGGLEAFVGGIICNDPEYLMARSGAVPFVQGSVSHSQQCMLHGDSYHQADNSLHVYQDALESALKTETFFGYLDHPFSAYQYGWMDEAERLGVHEEYLDFIASKPGIWFASLSDTLDFLWDRAHTSIVVVGDEIKHSRGSTRSKKPLAARFKNKKIKL